MTHGIHSETHISTAHGTTIHGTTVHGITVHGTTEDGTVACTTHGTTGAGTAHGTDTVHGMDMDTDIIMRTATSATGLAMTGVSTDLADGQGVQAACPAEEYPGLTAWAPPVPASGEVRR